LQKNKRRKEEDRRREQLVCEIEERAAPAFVEPLNGLDHFLSKLIKAWDATPWAAS
jgi:hypothetical protein